jgi:ATP-dependent DNA helicase RecQ
MRPIVFFDTEVNADGKIVDIGYVDSAGRSGHTGKIQEFGDFIRSSEYLCGHNIIRHDLKYIKRHRDLPLPTEAIDTLYLSPLLFPQSPYHSLVKDDKLYYDAENNPYNDALKARELFYAEIDAFNTLPQDLKDIFYQLLHPHEEFGSFFKFIAYNSGKQNIATQIKSFLSGRICHNAELYQYLSTSGIELAYTIALINTTGRDSITPRWVLRNFPLVDQIIKKIRNTPCLTGCEYCNTALDPHFNLRRFFKFDQFRQYDGVPLQENAVKAAISGESLLAIFPTGGGKSITFQLPALIAGESCRGLTVVISPLQSLMKDQVDNLEAHGITYAVTINGLLDPIERAKSFERVENGSATLLYISPESLRSPTITRLLLGRKISRFVIDEAHCFSAWGQDFRVDYLYIGEFIKDLEAKKNLQEKIPISCFTATAKQKVIEDICLYFKERNNLDLTLFSSSASRTNLTYRVLEKSDDEEKYSTLRNLIEEKNCPTIVYVSRTRRATELSLKLKTDGIKAGSFHGKMDIAEKTANQDAFIKGELDVMVATSAFGMGVDKKDVGMVVHYEISDSLENYIQEAGRAGRDEKITADCYVLFNEEDLSKHFILLNQTKLSIKEIQQVWRAIKDLTRSSTHATNSPLEIARKAGWDDSAREIETRVTTAIAALEESRYVKRGQNIPRIFANSILSKTAQEAIAKINTSTRFDDKEKANATRIIKKLFSIKRKKEASDEVAESRVDYISDHLGLVKEQVIGIVNLLREEKILADQKDLTAYVRKGETKKSLSALQVFAKLEKCFFALLADGEQVLNVKATNQQLELQECADVTPNKIKTIINFWAIKNIVRRRHRDYSKNTVTIECTGDREALKQRIEKRHELASFIINYLYTKVENSASDKDSLVEFSVYELKSNYELPSNLFVRKCDPAEIEDALFFLSRIEAIKIEGGFLVVYNRLTIERLELNNKIQYKNDDYAKLSSFYDNRVQQIHIVGEYAKKMVYNYDEALKFVNDYFQLNTSSFLTRYFPGSRQNDIKRNITPAKYRQLFGTLTAEQRRIIDDRDSRYVVVAAGPGSGKTRVLVHKLAALALMEDVKTDQMLMLTFSRAAASEFKRKLMLLIGTVAYYIDVKTFHSYCFDLLGQVGSIEKSGDVIQHATEKIRSGEVEQSHITKSVLVIDEAQDMDVGDFELVKALMEQNEEMRVIAVGDDDQNIYAFRNADSKYMRAIANGGGVVYELVRNFRSASNLVDFSNQFVTRLSSRLKVNPIEADKSENGFVKIINYKSTNLVQPLVDSVAKTGLKGTTCVLTHTNQEAAHVAALLNHMGSKARLIQSNDGFNLYNLEEVRFFIDNVNRHSESIISDEVWASARREVEKQYHKSENLSVVFNLLRDFQATCGHKKYKSDLEVFIKESKLEDFYETESDIISVSTIHKAKGREFDNVFLLLNNVSAHTDEQLRELYVAITRAKANLYIHTNGRQFDGISCANLDTIEDSREYALPNELTVSLTLRDAILDHFIDRQHLLENVHCGTSMSVKPDGCVDSRSNYLLKFSMKCRDMIEKYKHEGYVPAKATVNFVVYWKKEGSDVECRTIIPEILFERVR